MEGCAGAHKLWHASTSFAITEAGAGAPGGASLLRSHRARGGAWIELRHDHGVRRFLVNRDRSHHRREIAVNVKLVTLIIPEVL
jgi:hypothetical protein